jgi:hypothetical protein
MKVKDRIQNLSLYKGLSDAKEIHFSASAVTVTVRSEISLASGT